MVYKITMLQAAEDYELYLKSISNGTGYKPQIKQFRTAFYRICSTGGKGPSSIGVSRMNSKLLQKVRAYYQTRPASEIVILGADFHRGAEILGTPRNSISNYAPCIQRFITWGKNQGLCQKQDELFSPGMYKRGQGTRAQVKVTNREGRYERYRLKREDTNESLRATLEEMNGYLVDEFCPFRATRKVKPSTAKKYLERTERILGYLAYHASPTVPLDLLSLESIIPVLDPDELDDLTGREKRQRWNKVCDHVEKLLCSYLKFTQDFSSSFDPGTHADVVSIFKTIFHYLYRYQVRHRSDYRAFPLESLLSRHLDEKLARKRQRQKTHKRTADQTLKFPDPEPNRMEIQILREDVSEILRQETRPKHQYGTWKTSQAIAKHLQLFLMWAWLTHNPARRQEEQRTLRIWLYCDIQKPPKVPSDGWYWPMPKRNERELDSDQQPCDNYLCRLYSHEGVDYPEGVYVLCIYSYKTEATGGPQEIPLRNESFQEGSSEIKFYDYLDRWLSGHWCKSLGKSDIYTWWDQRNYGLRGRWASSGRMALNPRCDDHHRVNDRHLVARWGFVFLTQRTGQQFSDSSYSKAFSVPAQRRIHKKVTPHVLRSVWATWGIEVGLTYDQLESLAYAMGHTVETLKRIYERCRPERKRRPIEKRLDQGILPLSSSKESARLETQNLLEQIQQLQPEQLTQLKLALGKLDDEPRDGTVA